MDLYNKYRPRRFEDMYPTSPIVRSIGHRIATYLAEGTPLPHAYLFRSVEPGLGKTTTARLMTIALNPDLSEGDREAIITGRSAEILLFREIDGANDRKIAETRELAREIAALEYAAIDGNFVFVVNEAHKLTADAQDVFLALLENIPENVFMIFTTTDESMLNSKLLSRFEKHDFQPLDEISAASLLSDVYKAETGNIIAPSVCQEIYAEVGGRGRDMLILLSQYIGSGEIHTAGRTIHDVPAIVDLIVLFEQQARGESVSWGQLFAPKLRSVLQIISPDEVRRALVYEIASRIIWKAAPMHRSVSMALMDVYAEMVRPLSPGMPSKGELGLRLYHIYLTILQRNLEATPRTNTSRPERQQPRRDHHDPDDDM